MITNHHHRECHHHPQPARRSTNGVGWRQHRLRPRDTFSGCSTRSEDFYLATREDLLMATREDFYMATDKARGPR
jgi:hypothetical protein